MAENIDRDTVRGFGEEWETFDQSALGEAEHAELFERYFRIFPFDSLPRNAAGFDLGCGSGRWARGVAPRVGTLICIDPAAKALEVARRNLASCPNVTFQLADAETMAIPDDSLDFGYSLGVLHHVPDTARAMRSAVRKLKPGAPFLVYLYYRFDNRPAWFRSLWRVSDAGRRVVSRLPFGVRRRVSDLLALGIYWPLSRIAKLAEARGMKVANFPLSSYRSTSLLTMRTDALDRFGTRLEQRFTRAEIEKMMQQAGLENIKFSEEEPYWVACGRKATN